MHTEVLALLHVPPAVSSNVVADPAHTLAAPLGGAGFAYTVKVCVAEQPEVNL